jgi:hypothetical protein
MIKKNDLPSLFAGKCHALLCRRYEKGRDWFDLNWFINKGVVPNYPYLTAMMYQQGPWKDQKIAVTKQWLCAELCKKTGDLNFEKVNNEVKRFANIPVVFTKDMLNKQIEKFESPKYDHKKSRGIGR